MKKYLFAVMAATLLFACGSEGDSNSKKVKNLVEVSGAPYELVVVCDNSVWDSPAGDTVINFFQEPVLMLNMPEPRFTLMHKRVAGFKGIFKIHRNVLIMTLNDSLKDSDKYQYDVTFNEWAKPQVVINLVAGSNEVLAKAFEEKADEIWNVLEENEQERFKVKFDKFAYQSNLDTMAATVDVTLKLPKNYKINNAIKPDFIWFSYEMPLSSQGVILYTYPYDGQTLDTEFLVEMRNEFVKRVPGQLEGTYMQTSPVFVPIVEDIEYNGVEWKKMKGYWNVYNDFMGGPFRNYTTIDKANNRIVSVDMYVYSPDGGKKQRNYIKQLNALMRTVNLNPAQQ